VKKLSPREIRVMLVRDGIQDLKQKYERSSSHFLLIPISLDLGILVKWSRKRAPLNKSLFCEKNLSFINSGFGNAQAI
jgi:hypothetical protein